jgi:mannose-6-phosphate isomerase-like protein (cupin superfamily)
VSTVRPEDRKYQPLDESDPDDYRPNSRLAFVIDSGHSPVRTLSFIFETCAPGDYIPLHTHTTDEAIIVEDGEAEVTLGDETRRVTAGSVVFVPAGTKHAWGNPTDKPLRAQGVFPTDVLDIAYLARNPAPGTEGNPPQPPMTLDLRKLSG